jgi:molybdopterin-guanine dinucleotide biosynthesis protein B
VSASSEQERDRTSKPYRIHVVGRRNHGKTTLLVELVEELRRRELRVGTLKHSSHTHELDTPGKDSHRHRLAGGDPAAIITPELCAAYLPRSSDGSDDPYARLAPLYEGCDLLLVEGNLERPDGLKLEVWRAERGTEPRAREGAVAAVITDDALDDLPAGVVLLPRADVPGLADWLLDRLEAGQ